MTAPRSTHQVIDTGAVRIFVRDEGTAPGVPVLLVPGLGFASWSWEETLSALSPRRRVIAIDNRGAGQSDKPPGPYTVEMLADDAAAVLSALGVETAHVVGSSMGGYVALSLAERHPERVRSLVLVGTSQGGPGAMNVPAATAQAWREAAALGPRALMERSLQLSFPPGWSEGNAERFQHLLAQLIASPTPQASWLAQFRACEQHFATGVNAASLRQPALVVHGTEDRIVPYPNGVALAAALPSNVFWSIEGGGHLPFLEQPEAFHRRVESFFDAKEDRP